MKEVEEEERGRGGAERGGRRRESMLLSLSLSQMKTDGQSFYISHGRKPPSDDFDEEFNWTKVK